MFKLCLVINKNTTNYMQFMLMRLMSKIDYLIVSKGTKFTGYAELG